MKDRIIKFIEAENLTAAEFADHIGVQRSSVSHVLNGRNNPSFAFIQKIIEHYPNVNSRWLLTGEGSIYEEEKTTKAEPSKKESNLFSTDNVQRTKARQKTNEDSRKLNGTSETEQPTPIPKVENVPEIPQRKVVKVLIFYDDQTFEDFRPAK